MIPERVYLFAHALKQVSTFDGLVDMDSTVAGDCGTPGCHGWLARKALDMLGVPEAPGDYHFTKEGHRLSRYLMGVSPKTLFPEDCFVYNLLEKYAAAHPLWWGNKKGDIMFCCASAFGQDPEEGPFPEDVVVAHWAGVARRGYMI